MNLYRQAIIRSLLCAKPCAKCWSYKERHSIWTLKFTTGTKVHNYQISHPWENKYHREGWNVPLWKGHHFLEMIHFPPWHLYTIPHFSCLLPSDGTAQDKASCSVFPLEKMSQWTVGFHLITTQKQGLKTRGWHCLRAQFFLHVREFIPLRRHRVRKHMSKRHMFPNFPIASFLQQFHPKGTRKVRSFPFKLPPHLQVFLRLWDGISTRRLRS